MSDSTTEAAIPAPHDDGAALSALRTSVNRQRIWLIWLTVVTTVSVLCVLSVVALFTIGFSSALSQPSHVSAEQLGQTKQEVERAYGDKLQKVEARAITLEIGGGPSPFTILPGADSESIYVEYSLRGSSVVVAGLLGGTFGNDIASSGMLPTEGSLASRMSLEQFQALLAAYGAETTSPLGSVRRYNDDPYANESGSKSSDEISVGAQTYPTKELWSAAEGRIIKGGRVDMNDSSSFARKAFIFREDPATGQFTFLGTEAADTIW